MIEAENFAIANAFMWETFGNDWSMLYDEVHFAEQVEKFDLTELKISEQSV